MDKPVKDCIYNLDSKRTELCCRTNMSEGIGLIKPAELIERCDEFGLKSIAVTDFMTVQAFRDMYWISHKCDSPIKIIFGVESVMFGNGSQEWPVFILAKNRTGLKNLYTLLSWKYSFCFNSPNISKEMFERHREGLLIGCTTQFIKNICNKKPDDSLSFYNYIQITPWDSKSLVKKAIELGESYNIPVIVSCAARILDKEDRLAADVWNYAHGNEAEEQIPYMMRTEELLNAFNYLGEQKAREVVLTNPELISDKIEAFNPSYPYKLTFHIDGAKENLEKICYDKAHILYGEMLPQAVEERLSKELSWIQENDFSDILYSAKLLVDKSRKDGYIVGNRGCLSASFVVFLAGISEINPLEAHYYCSDCGYFEIAEEERNGIGSDLKEKICPNCGAALNRDGYNIPAETFFGLDGNKEPDIDFNFASEYQKKASENLKEIFGKGNVFRAGTVGTTIGNMAYEYIDDYLEAISTSIDPKERERCADIIQGAKRTEGLHPGGYLILPKGADINEITPVRRVEHPDGTDELATHLEYHSMDHNLYKYDILGHRTPEILHRLHELTGVNPTMVDISDSRILDLFKGTDSIGITPNDICGCRFGTLGIPEFSNRYVMDIMKMVHPETINDLLRITGLAHSTDGWKRNAEELISSGMAKPSEVIAFRDDVYLYLIEKGFDKEKSFKIARAVRTGRLNSSYKIADWQVWKKEMAEHGIPDWYIKSCEKIRYLFPKAHSASYTLLSLRIAYYKVYHSEAFYQTVLEYEIDDAIKYIHMSDEELDKNIELVLNAPYGEDTYWDSTWELLLIKEMRARNINICI